MSDFVHLHNHSIYSALDGVATPREYFETCAERGYIAHALTEHGNMASVPDAYLASLDTGVKYIPGCFLPNQYVIGEKEIKEISKFRPGDKVITHKNNFKEILNVQIKHHDDKIIKIKSWCMEDIICTTEHPFLIRTIDKKRISACKSKDIETISFIQAKDLEVKKYCRTPGGNPNKKNNYKHYLCVPKIPTNNIHELYLPDFIFKLESQNNFNVVDKLIQSVTYHKENYKTAVGLPEYLQLDNELCWIMGLWLAEGSYHNGLCFTLNKKDELFALRIKKYFKQFDIYTNIKIRNDRNVINVMVHSIYFERLFRKLFNEYCHYKQINSLILYGLNQEKTEWFLNGILGGDGEKDNNQQYLKLCDKNLIWQCRAMMTRLNKYSAISEVNDSGFNLNSKYYSVRFSNVEDFDYDDEYLYLPIHTIEENSYCGPVYNLEIKDDNSYNIGVAVHNCELYYNDQELQRRQLDKDGIKPKDMDDEILKNRLMKQRHLLVLCKTTDGYKNLLDIKKKSYDFFYRKPRANFKLLYENRKDLIILSGCMNGPMSFELRNYIETENEIYKIKAIKIAKTFQKVFKDDFYVELQMPGVEHDARLFRELQYIADELKIKTVLTNDSHYITEDDYNLQRIMMSIDQDLPFDSPHLFISKSRNGYLKTKDDLRRTFEHGHEIGDEILPPYNTDGIGTREFELACNTTLEIANKCDVFKPDRSTKLPVIEGEKDQLWKLVCKGLIKKNLNNNKIYKDRAKFEMDRIIEKEFCSYFLICVNLVQKSTIGLKMPVGPRGSAGGSLVCYLIGIHDIDPIKWELSFDRFLSNSRGGRMLRANMDDDELIST